MIIGFSLLCAGVAGAAFGDNAWQVVLGQACWLAAYWLACRFIDWVRD